MGRGECREVSEVQGGWRPLVYPNRTSQASWVLQHQQRQQPGLPACLCEVHKLLSLLLHRRLLALALAPARDRCRCPAVGGACPILILLPLLLLLSLCSLCRQGGTAMQHREFAKLSTA